MKRKKLVAIVTTALLAFASIAGCGSSSSSSSESEASSSQTSATTSSSVSTESFTQEASEDVGTSSTTESVVASSSESVDLPELPEEIKEKGKLVIGVKADFAPFGYIDENGNNVGYDLEIGKKLAEYAFGDPNAVDFVVVTSSNRIPFLTSNKVDLLLASMAITEERLQEIDFTNIYMSTGHLIMTMSDNDSINGIDDLQNSTIIVVDGTTGADAAAKLCPNAKLQKYETWSEALSALKAGRGDAIIHDESVLYETANSDNSVKTIGEPFENTWIAGGVRKGDEEWLNWINAAFEKMQNDDFFYEEFKQFFTTWTSVPEGLPRKGDAPITPASKGF